MGEFTTQFNADLTLADVKPSKSPRIHPQCQCRNGTCSRLVFASSKCSGGMLQQAAMIRAFQNDPALILADEPFSALDVNIAASIRASFCNLVRKRGITAVIVLHQLHDLVEVCDEVLVIPGRPFSIEVLPRLDHAVVIKNEILREGRPENHRLGFVALAKLVLGESF